ncbi:MAG: DNA mismatch endonuclease Vsr [Oxalicibacterium faecigallinarum]|uniref:very short patch repair endonuclease n=1 Tax=Oxalicibacterium faecigallinarum TaxID=573741 RepID=UPI002808F19B|nr:DNA mismatch endonuclease Vsr [Oxalicibacterium faecigallinarum]MDQ7969283.1 DNA mismatch endonuclease Vsr [Oxalicibacterium faecigallinarum]
MVDILSKADRSLRMSQIRSKNTKPELKLRSVLHKRGYRFRIHIKDLPGKPDIVFSKRKICVFVNGCFWHGHRCSVGHTPKTNSQFWTEKIRSNRRRDAKNIKELRKLHWKVVIVWECSLTPRKVDDTCRELERVLSWG